MIMWNIALPCLYLCGNYEKLIETYNSYDSIIVSDWNFYGLAYKSIQIYIDIYVFIFSGFYFIFLYLIKCPM